MAVSWIVLFSLAAALLSSCCCDTNISALSDQYRFSTQLGDNYYIFWTFDLATQRIDFAVRVGTTGWVGFGLSPNGQMPRSDVVIGWVDSNGQAFFHVSHHALSDVLGDYATFSRTDILVLIDSLLLLIKSKIGS